MKYCSSSFFIPNNRSEMITWSIDKVSGSVRICDNTGWLELNCSVWTHATPLMWCGWVIKVCTLGATCLNLNMLTFGGRDLKWILDEMSDTGLTCDCQMLSYWLQQTSVAAARLTLIVFPKLCTPVWKTLENLTENLYDSIMNFNCIILCIYLNWNIVFFLFGTVLIAVFCCFYC